MAIAPPTLARAQASAREPASTPLEATGGSELERYFRAMALVGAAPDPGLAVRSYAPRELRAFANAHGTPWESRIRPAGPCRMEATALPVTTRVVWESSFPFSLNDGPLVIGRGATVAASAGVAGCLGPLTVVAQPVAFWTQNRDFRTVPTGHGGALRFANPVFPLTIDLPQRFGDAAVHRVDPGQTTVRLDVGPFAAGWSTAAETWGPAAVQALVMGQNAPGYPHVFVGTSGLQSIRIGRVSARLTLGLPEDSPFAAPLAKRRELAGGVFSFAPAFIPGLEVGLTRVFHQPVEPQGVQPGDLLDVVQSFFQSSAARERKNDPAAPDYRPDNQLASAFGAWTFPRAGLRAYGELLKNDNNLDMRELITEPDHDAAFVLGIEQAVHRSADGRRLVVANAEVVNARISHLNRVRNQANAYEHSVLVQGHTNRGMLLGSPAVFGGGGQHLGVDSWSPRGRLSFFADRLMRNQLLVEGEPTTVVNDVPFTGWDVQHSLGAELLRFAGALEWSASARYIRETNRDYRGDATSWRLSTSLTYRPRWRVAARTRR